MRVRTGQRLGAVIGIWNHPLHHWRAPDPGPHAIVDSYTALCSRLITMDFSQMVFPTFWSAARCLTLSFQYLFLRLSGRYLKKLKP